MEMILKNKSFKELSINKETKEITLVEQVFEKYDDYSHKIYDVTTVFKKGDDVSMVPYETFKIKVQMLWN